MLTARNLFGIGLIAINLIAYIIMIQSGELIGDVKGVIVHDYTDLFLAVTLVCGSYFLILFVLYPFFLKVKLPKIYFKNERMFDNRIGIVLLILQVLFLLFSVLNGVNISGSGNVKTSSIFTLFWVFFPTDLFFVIYYGFCRNSRMFKLNIAVAIVSSLMRGRADIFLLILFFEVAIRIRNKELTFKKLSVLGLGVVLLYPLLNVTKFAFRLYLGEKGGQSLDYYFIDLMSGTESLGYSYAVFSGVEHLIGRLQTVSIVAEISRFSTALLDMYYQDGFFPFWLEGLHGILLDRILNEPRNIPLGTAFTAVGDFNWTFNVGDWNISPSLAGWVILNPLWFGGFLLYIIVLCFFSMLFTKMIGDSELRNDMLWFAWAFYLMPAWLGVFVLFIYTLFLFLVLKLLLTSIPPLNIMGRLI